MAKRLVKRKTVLNYTTVDKAVSIQGTDGVMVFIAGPGDAILYDDDGAFKGVVDDKKLREEYLTV